MKIAIAEQYGFILSVEALKQLVLRLSDCMEIDNELVPDEHWRDAGNGFSTGFLNQTIAYLGNVYTYNDCRTDPILIKLIETLGADVLVEDSGPIKIVEVPDGIDWYIEENEYGSEVIHEKHRTWS